MVMIAPRAGVYRAAKARTAYYWWSRPSRFVLFLLLPIYLYCGSMGEAFYALYGHRGKYLVDECFILGAIALLAFVVGAACTEGGAVRQRAPGWVRPGRARTALAALYFAVLGAYAIFLYPITLRPGIVLEHLRGSHETMVTLRLILNRVPGVTSFVALQSLCIVLSLHYRQLTGQRLPGVYRVLFVGVVIACVLRAWLWSERLALIEILVPAAIARYAFIQETRSHLASCLMNLAPVAGFAIIFVLFCIGEYSRSWQYYKDYLPYTFLEFSWNRFIGYFATALQNGALAYKVYPTEYFPFMTASWFYKIPFFKSETEFDQGEFLAVYLNPEFNNMSGVFMAMRDFGPVLGIACWILIGMLSGSIYRSFATGQLPGLLLYPVWFVGIAEILRVFYWGDSRFFPVLLIGPLVVYYLGASMRIVQRRVL